MILKAKNFQILMAHRNFNCFSNANLSLCGCGFMCIYHAGVCAALREYAPQLTRNRIYGASAGSIAAAGLICNVSVAEATTAILQVVAEARSGVLQAFSPTFDLMSIVRDELDRILPENAHQLCTGRLFVSLTQYETGRNVIISDYSSKKELIQAILCSCFIPIFCGYSIPEFRGCKYIDGGFSDNQPVFDENTITISPFSGESDICPMDHASASIIGFVYYNTSIRFNNENFYRFCSCFVPPSQEICSKICRQGFTDALRFLTRNSITPCTKCLSAQSVEYVSLELKRSRSYFNIQQATANVSTKRRKKLDSECDVCLARLEQRLSSEMTTALFPEVLHKTLQEPVNCLSLSAQLFRYFQTFRAVKFGLRVAEPFLRTCDYTIFVLKMLNEWLRKTSKKDIILDRLQHFVDFLLQQIEEQNLLCTPNISCQYQFTASKAKEACFDTLLFEDIDSHECVITHSTQFDTILADYYIAIATSFEKDDQHHQEKQSESEYEQKSTEEDINANPMKKVSTTENDSGMPSSIASNTPITLSSLSSDDGARIVMKRDVALSPVRALISGMPRPKFSASQSRRHTVGINSVPTTKDASGSAVGSNAAGAAPLRRRSTQSLNKPTGVGSQSLGSKHSSMSGSQGSSNKHRKKNQAQSSSSSSCSGDEQEFFIPARMLNRQHRRVSEGGYEGEPSSDT